MEKSNKISLQNAKLYNISLQHGKIGLKHVKSSMHELIT